MGPTKMIVGHRDKEFRPSTVGYFMDTEFGSRSSPYKSSHASHYGRRSNGSGGTTSTQSLSSTPTESKPTKSLSSTPTRAITPRPTTLVSAPLSSTLSSSVPSTFTDSVLSEPTSVVSSGSSSPMLSGSSISGETTPTTSQSYASSSTYMSTWDYGTGPYISRATRDLSTSPESQCSAFNISDFTSEDDSSEV